MQRPQQRIGVALQHTRGRVAALQELAEFFVEFEQDQAAGIEIAGDQRRGHRAGAGAKLDDRAGRSHINLVGHRLGERAA